MNNGMDKAGARLFLVYLLSLVVFFGGLALAKGGLYVDRHEGDTLHLIEIVLRMVDGQWPHLDFVTPLGALNFLPIVGFVRLGFGVGTAILLAQIFAALLMVPMMWWLARSRLSRGIAYAVGGLVMILTLAMIHGEAVVSVSMSMHYNRWAWALAFIAILIAALDPTEVKSQVVDGLCVGVAFAFFFLGKITFGMAFLPGVAVALVLRSQWRALAVAAGVLALAALIVTVSAGPEIWTAYLADLKLVASTDIRPRAGVNWSTLLTAPQYIVGNVALALAIVVLRGSNRSQVGLVLALLAPGMIYVTYQNYGGDPKWLALVAVLLLAVSRSWKSIALALICATIVAPSFINMAVSPLRHLRTDTQDYLPLFEDTPYASRHGDFFTKAERVNRILMRTPLIFEAEDLAYLNARADRMETVTFQGDTFSSCVQELGLIGASHAIARDLDDAGLSGKSVFVADTFANLWMFGGLEPLPGGAPWYYGDLSGYANADYLLVPTCAITPRAFRAILKDIEARGQVLEKVRENELFKLYKTP